MERGSLTRRSLLGALVVPVTGCATLTGSSEPSGISLGDVRIVNMSNDAHHVHVTVVRNEVTVLAESFRVEPPEGPEARILIEPVWGSNPAIFTITANLLGTDSEDTITVSTETVDENWKPCRYVSGEISNRSGQGASIGLGIQRPPGDLAEDRYCSWNAPDTPNN